jgi:hypothetical protein
MSSGTDNPAYGRFNAFSTQRSPRSAEAPWSHSAKVLLWVGLGVASWAVVIFSGYFIWSAL